MFRKIYGLFKVGDITICAHWSFVISVALLGLFFNNYFTEALPLSAKSPITIFLYTALTMILIYASLLIHEFAHSAVSAKYGAPVNYVVFFAFGAAAITEKDINSAGGEFKMAIAGPLASVIIAGLAYGLSIFGSAVEILNQTKYIPIFQILGWVYSINLYIAIFNLIPAFPMDGGRILRAGLWHLAKDKSGATRVSAYLALWIGILGLISPIFFGLQMFFIALIGFFIIQTALGTLMQLKIKANLKTLEKPEQNQNNESAKSENKTDENKNK